MLTYIQDIIAAEAQRKHRTPESPDGYFPDRCLKKHFFFFSRCGYSSASASSWKGRQKLEKKMKRQESHGQVTVALEEKGKVRRRRLLLLTANLGLEAALKAGASLLLAAAGGLLALALGALLLTALA